MNRFLIVFLLLFLFQEAGFGARSQQEQLEVVGTVTASDGIPLSGVSVAPLSSPNNQTASADDGTYRVLTATNDTLLFTFVGYQPLKIAVEGRAQIHVTLE